MANKTCDSCEQLRELAPDFVINGLGDDECENLANNKGLAGNSDDCTDLHNMNDCLVGFMEDEIDAYETCDWKKYMKEFVPNVWTVFKGIICAICGIWCKLEAMNSGIDLTIGEDETDDSYIVAGRGVSFLTTGDADNGYTSDISLTNYGNFVRINGSVDFRADNNFTEPNDKKSWNFDNMDTIRHTNARKSYSLWHHANGTTENLGPGGELIYEIRIKKSAYPAIASIASGTGAPTGGGAYQTNFVIFDGDDVSTEHPTKYAYGQHNRCDEDGNGENGGDDGHAVEKGWIYIQHRMVNISVIHASDNNVNKYTPRGWCAIRLNMDEIEC